MAHSNFFGDFQSEFDELDKTHDVMRPEDEGDIKDKLSEWGVDSCLLHDKIKSIQSPLKRERVFLLENTYCTINKIRLLMKKLALIMIVESNVVGEAEKTINSAYDVKKLLDELLSSKNIHDGIASGFALHLAHQHCHEFQSRKLSSNQGQLGLEKLVNLIKEVQSLSEESYRQVASMSGGGMYLCKAILHEAIDLINNVITVLRVTMLGLTAGIMYFTFDRPITPFDLVVRFPF